MSYLSEGLRTLRIAYRLYVDFSLGRAKINIHKEEKYHAAAG
jgi:hypothetical protein